MLARSRIPHSFVRLPDNNLLSTFQMHMEDGHEETGGLVELAPDGRALRWASAAAPAIDTTVRPYSLAILPAIDRVVTTATDMHGVLRVVRYRCGGLRPPPAAYDPPAPGAARGRELPEQRAVVLPTAVPCCSTRSSAGYTDSLV